MTLLGGIGLFLLGMQTMTEALQRMGSRGLRRFLARFTRSPLTGVATGAAATAVIQSSSATTLMAMGFVGAGLLSFPHAVGIIFGANIGTTFTGWLVILLGFKLEIGLLAMPLLFAAVLGRMLLGGTWARVAEALAGFSLIFLGIATMQGAMEGFEGVLTPGDFPPDTWGGRFRLMLLGVAITIVTQSSSAGVAMALVLIGSGAIGFTQGAAMVIGMDIGTTLKAIVASLSGSRAMRQTGLAHVVYNLITGSLAFATLGLTGPLVYQRIAGGDAQIGLVAFHTLFNLVGALVMVPFATPFARLIEWLLPESGPALTAALDDGLLRDPDSATAAARATLRRIAEAQFGALGQALAPGGDLRRLNRRAERTGEALTALEDYLERIDLSLAASDDRAHHVALLHQTDHLRRLNHRMGQHQRIAALLEDPSLARPARAFGALLRRVSATGPRPSARDRAFHALLSRRLERLRRQSIAEAPARDADIDRLFARTDGMRWLLRSATHALRYLHYADAAA